MSQRDEFLQYLDQQTGAPPPPFATWADLRSAAAALPEDELTRVFDEVSASFVVDTDGTDYSRWSDDKRKAANAAAAAALRGALSRGSATAEEIRAMQAYTGFGGVKHIGVLPDVYPREYVAASREWEENKIGGVVSEETNAIMGRVKDQYFTPLDACAAMHTVLARTNPQARDYLETSAGIGRALRAAPAGKRWTAVELDKLMADMLRMSYPGAEVLHGPFEQYAKQLRGRFDVVVGNPPYGKRGSFGQLDMPQVDDMESYFFLRAAQALRPGGTVALLVRAAFLTTENRADVREALIRGCVFRGALLVPNGAFPTVRETTFAIVVFTRRAASVSADAFSARERAVVEGRYFELDEANGARLGGEWKDSSRGGQYLHGRPDYTRANSVWLAPGPAIEAQPRTSAPAPKTSVPMPPSAIETPPDPVVTTAEVEDAEKAAAAALAADITAWIRLINSDPYAAEDQRVPLRNRVVDHVVTYGNPHPKGPPALRAVVTKAGQIEPVLERSVIAGRVADEPPEGAGLAELVDYWCERKGFAEPADVGTTLEIAAEDPEVFVDLRAEGPVLLSRWAFLSGPPAAILANVDRALGNPVLDASVRSKLEAQKSIVLQLWSAPRTLAEIDVDVRSPFVPLAALEDWVNSNGFLPKDSDQQPRSLRTGGGGERITLTVAETFLQIDDNAALRNVQFSEDVTYLYWLVGYYNRSTKAEAFDASGVEKDIYKKGADMAAVDKAANDRFREWLADSPWVAAVESEYNLKFAPQLVSPIPTGPVPLRGLGNVTLHPHQNQIVRRCSLGGRARPFLWAADVGAGKCRRAESLTVTSEGLRPIGALFGADVQGVEPELVLPAPDTLRVLSYVNGRPVWSKVRALYRQRISDQESTVVVRTERGSKDEVTRAHPFPVVRRGQIEWVPAGALVAGDVLAVSAHLAEPEHPSAAPDDDLCEIMGWLIGDGHESESTAILTQADVSVLERVLGLVEARYGRGQTRTGLPWARIEIPDDEKHVPYLSISIPAFKQDLLDWGYPWGASSSGRRLPRWALGASDHKLRTLLRAYMDADGSPAADACAVEVASASPHLADDIRYALLRFGVRTTRVVKMKAATNSRTPVERPYIYLSAFGEDAENFHRNVGFGLSWKTARLSANTDRKRNPNNGLPIGDLIEDLAECGVSVRMLTGFVRQGDFRSASRETVDQMVNALQRRLSAVGAAEMALTSAGRKKLASIDEHRDTLQDVLARLRSLRQLSETMRFEVVDSIDVGRSGGFVYDIEVDQEDYNDQNYVAGDGGLVMHNTFAGSATAMRWRQIGAAARPVVVVPTSVLAKWYDDGKRLFPNGDIGLIGLTPTGKGKSRPDTPEIRLEKWLRFAAGAYDYVIVGKETFERDIEPSQAEVADVLSDVVWTRRKNGAAAIAKLRRLKNKIARLRALIPQYAAVSSEKQWKVFFPKYPGLWPEHRDKKLAEAQKTLEAAQVDLAKQYAELGVTDSEAATVQNILANIVRNKPYRPNDARQGMAAAAAEDAEDTGILDDDEPDEPDDEEDESDGEEIDDEIEVKTKKKNQPHFPLPGLVMWSDLGIDALVVDEAHKFKNIWFPSEKIEYAGKGADVLFGSKGAWDMYIKTRLLHKRAGGLAGILFLTATPATNSPLELYTLIDMVSPPTFQGAGIYDKEQFIDRFWEIKVKDMPTPAGAMVKRPQVTGFKNGDELNGIIAPVFQRLSTAELMAAGWLRALPVAEPERLYFPRDPAQTALIRSLVAMYVTWRGESRDEDGNIKQRSACGLDQVIEPYLWSVTPDGDLVQGQNVRTLELPEPLTGKRKRFSQGILHLVWQTMIDKAANAPLLIIRYVNERRASYEAAKNAWDAFDDYDNAVQAWEDRKKRGPKPQLPRDENGKLYKRPKTSDFIKAELAIAMGDNLALDDLAAYYERNPILPKLARMAQEIAANIDRSTFQAPTSDPESQVESMQQQVDALLIRANQQPYVLVSAGSDALSFSGPSAQVQLVHARLSAAKKTNPVRDQGRCGHVVFCDYTELYPAIKQAIIQATNGAIPASRITQVPSDKSKRLIVSQKFNGADATSMTEAVEPAYDVILGSTAIMGEGIDLQRRSCAVHHLNLPWTPAELHQRNGRAVRQGNTMGFVDVFYYLTERSFDVIRFDRIAKKALWWEALFSGQARTANPAAEQDVDLDELILSLVIEDPAVLQTCLQQIREERRAAELLKKREKADKDWLAVNERFARARASADAARRSSAFSDALRRLELFRIEYRAFLETLPEGSVDGVEYEPVAVDWRTGMVLRTGQTRTNLRNQHADARYLIEAVKLKTGFRVDARQFGKFQTSPLILGTELIADLADPWTFEDEKGFLASDGASSILNELANLAPSLWVHADRIWSEIVYDKYRTTHFWTTRIPPKIGPIIVRPDGSVFVFAQPDQIALRYGGDRKQIARLVDELGRNVRVLPLEHPDARSTWVEAVKTDRVFVPAPSYAGIQLARGSTVGWKWLTKSLFGDDKILTALRQRLTLTNEPNPKED